MKAILISIKPEWVAKILNGEKTIEIRKTMPKCDLPIDVYIYCTKDKDILYENVLTNNFYLNLHSPVVGVEKRNGKVVAKFTLNKVEKIIPQNFTAIKEHEILKQSCLRENELFDYISKNNGEPDNPFYAWHISNLVIFDEPKELSEFYKVGAKEEYEHIMSIDETQAKPYVDEFYKITNAPQSFCYVEVVEQ